MEAKTKMEVMEILKEVSMGFGDGWAEKEVSQVES